MRDYRICREPSAENELCSQVGLEVNGIARTRLDVFLDSKKQVVFEESESLLPLVCVGQLVVPEKLRK